MNGTWIAIGIGGLVSLGAWCVARDRLGASAERPLPEGSVAAEETVAPPAVVALEPPAVVALAPLEPALGPAAPLQPVEGLMAPPPGLLGYPADVDARMFSRIPPGWWEPRPAAESPQP